MDMNEMVDCLVHDPFGLADLAYIGEDMVSYERDYPHADWLWPRSRETLWESVRHLTDLQIEKVTHRDMMRFFNFDPFQHHDRQDLTVGALRAAAATPRSASPGDPSIGRRR